MLGLDEERMMVQFVLWLILLMSSSSATWFGWGKKTAEEPRPATSNQSTSTGNSSRRPPSNESPTASGLPRSTSRGTGIGMNVPSSNPIPMSRPSGGGLKRNPSSQRFSIDRSYSDEQPIVQVRQGVTSSFSPRFLSEATIELRDKRMFAVGYRDIEDILTQPYYFVDKSLFIYQFIEDKARIRVFLRPRKMGKSVNMSMLAAFFNCMQEPSAGFRRLPLLMRDPDRQWEGHLKGHCGKYFVIRIDWETSGILEASDEIEMEMRMLQYFQKMLRDTMETLRLKGEQVERAIPEHVDMGDMIKADGLHLATKALGTVAHILGMSADNQILVLIDDYDAILRKAAEVGAYAQIAEFLSDSFEQLAKLAGQFVWKVVAFGTQKLENDGYLGKIELDPTSIARRASRYTPVEYSCFGSKEDPYNRDFGFTEAEVIEALKELKSGLNIGELEEWYQVVSESTDTVLLHPHSVASAIKFGQVQQYWTWECPLRIDKYPFTKVLSMEGFGPGTLEQIALQPHSLEYNWPNEYIPLNYDPESDPKTIIRNILGWLHAEGYAARGQLSNHEAGLYLQQVADQWFDQQTGFIQALHAFSCEGDLSVVDLTDLRKSIDSILKMENFHGGNSPLKSGIYFTRFIRRLLSAVFPSLEPWALDGELLPVIQVRPLDYFVVSFDVSGRQPTPGFIASRLKMSKVINAYNMESHFWVLCCYVDTEGRPAATLTQVQ